MFRHIEEQALALAGEPVAMFFSGGKDAIAAAHLLRQHHRGPIRYLFLFFVDGLEVIERILIHYEKLWGIEIDRRPCHEALSLDAQAEGKRKTRYTYADTVELYRKETGLSWVCDGIKKADSLARRGMLKKCTDGIDWQGHFIHPLMDWTEKHVMHYCKLHRLRLPSSYNLGLPRSFWIPNAEKLIWLKTHFPRDYEKIIAKYPVCGDSVFKKLGRA